MNELEKKKLKRWARKKKKGLIELMKFSNFVDMSVLLLKNVLLAVMAVVVFGTMFIALLVLTILLIVPILVVYLFSERPFESYFRYMNPFVGAIEWVFKDLGNPKKARCKEVRKEDGRISKRRITNKDVPGANPGRD